MLEISVSTGPIEGSNLRRDFKECPQAPKAAPGLEFGIRTRRIRLKATPLQACKCRRAQALRHNKLESP